MKIYLSSTFTDLESHRRCVYDTLRKARHDVVSMEDYGAGPRRPLAKCMQDVAEADVYVGLFAWRYGYVPKKNNDSAKSITELEFQHARRLGKPCLIFLLKEEVPWRPAYMDVVTGEGQGGQLIKKLRGWFAEEYMVGWFDTPASAATEVLAAVYRTHFDQSLKREAQLAVADEAKREPLPGGTAKAREKYGKLWRPGDRLRIRFLGGSVGLQARIRAWAKPWLQHANLSFEFCEDPKAEIRVALEARAQSWCYVGTDCLAIPLHQPTMDLCLRDGDSEAEGRHVVLHEFGHAIGLMHEHQNPSRPELWNREAVYASYQGPPHHWSRKMIDDVVFSTWDPAIYPVEKPFDPQSIMIWPIPNEFTLGDFEIGWNQDISKGDAEFVRKLYP